MKFKNILRKNYEKYRGARWGLGTGEGERRVWRRIISDFVLLGKQDQ